VSAPFTVIIPARNEAVALGRTAIRLKQALKGHEAQVIYVLNATTDNSAAVIAQVFGDAVQIIMVPTPGKTVALNAGDAAAGPGIRVYLDADVTVAPDLFEKLLEPLTAGTADLVAPRIVVDLDQAGPAAKRIGRVWADQLWRREDAFMNCVVFSSNGQRARGSWPDVLADDDWARDQIDPARRLIVQDAYVRITAPLSLKGWLIIRARWIRGRRALFRLESKRAPQTWVRPRGGLLDLLLYYVVRVLAEPVAFAQTLLGVEWGRDESARRL